MKKTIINPQSWIIALCVISMVYACSKESPAPKDNGKEPIEDPLKNHADYNKKILSEVSNVYLENNITANNPLQFICKTEYQDQKIFHYTATGAQKNFLAQQTVVIQNNKGDKWVTEFDGNKGHLRWYLIDAKNNRGKHLLQVEILDEEQQEVSVLEVDWKTGNSSTLAAILLQNGKTISNYQKGEKRADNKANSTLGSRCNLPSTSNEITKSLDAFMPYLGCLLSQVADQAAIELKEVDVARQQIPDLLEKWQENIVALKDMLQKLNGKYSRFKTDQLPQADEGKAFTKFLIAADTVSTQNTTLILLDKISSTSWDNLIDTSSIRLVFQLTDKTTKKAFTDKPIFIDLQLSLKRNGSEYILLEETKPTNPATGQVTFNYKPDQNTDIIPTADDKWECRYKITNTETGEVSTELKVVDNRPGSISIVSGNEQTAPWETKLASPYKVRVLSKVGKPLVGADVIWTLTGGGTLSTERSLTNSQGVAEVQYISGKRSEGEGTVSASILDQQGNILISLSKPFIFIAKKSEYKLVLIEYTSDSFHPPQSKISAKWKNGDKVEVYNRTFLPFRIEKDGVIQKNSDGTPFEFIYSSTNIGITRTSRIHSFQKEDVVLKDVSILFNDMDDGHMDSVVVDLTISNRLYRKFIGSQIELYGAEGTQEGYLDYNNKGEVYTVQFAEQGVVVNSIKYPESNGKTFPYQIIHSYLEAPIYSCDAENSHVMKKAVGVISWYPYPSLLAGNAFILYEDDSISVLNLGSGYRPCDFLAIWKSLRYLPGG